MIYRSKAPLRLGLAGGGTDVSPYSDMYGGAILNCTISIYAHASIELISENKIIFESIDSKVLEEFDLETPIDCSGNHILAKGVYNRIINQYKIIPKGLKLSTYVDVPQGSGLGTSSSIVVAMIGAFVECFQLPLGEYDIAILAYDIERKDLNMSGGKQDQYAATFGGVNFMEFLQNDNVIVNPLRIKSHYIYELEHNLLLFYTASSRNSSTIIDEQAKNVQNNNEKSIEAMHNLKEQAIQMKEAILKGKIHEIGHILDFGFQNKKQMAKNISNDTIDHFYETAKKAGATGGKISGAGGGGFMMFYCPDNSRYNVINTLREIGGIYYPYQFEKNGLITWSI